MNLLTSTDVILAARAAPVPACLVTWRLVDAAVHVTLREERRLRCHETGVQLEAVGLVRTLGRPPESGEVDDFAVLFRRNVANGARTVARRRKSGRGRDPGNGRDRGGREGRRRWNRA